jgi:CubicO group peptidase (beta-lactamase class C family)
MILTRLSGLGLLLTAVAPAVTAQASDDSGAVARRAKQYLETIADAGALSGIVLLARNDTVLYHAAFGWADRPGGTPMTITTPIAVASISKPLTGIVIATLVEQGRLALTDPLARWLPEFPSASRITIDLLMSHRAGVRHRVTTADQERQPRTAAQMVPLIAAQPLLFEPGSRRNYSSMGYVVLARVLELASGAPYGQLLDEIVLGPAGTIASFDATRMESVKPARSFFMGGDGLIARAQRDLSFLVGAGSLYSTPSDLFAVFERC